jgi:NarL family two-component system response regulator LiaR
MPGSARRNREEPIRVLVVDDQATVRSGLRFFLSASEDMELVGEATNDAEALELCAEARPDVVLMDLMMPGGGAVDAIRTIRRCSPHTQVIVLTSFEAEKLVQAVLEAGATDYLLKNVSAEDLADAIRAAHADS